jgi:hypothetical protein
MSRKSISIVVGTALTALAVIVAGAGLAAADSPPATPPVPKQSRMGDVRAAALSPASSTTSFVSITPCRIADSRHGTGTNGKKLKKNNTRTFTIAGTGSLASQGGAAGGCGVPATARAVVLNAVAMSPSKKGSLKIWQTGLAEPSGTFLYYGSFTMSGSGDVTLPSGAQAGITVKNFTSTTNLVLDVTGYYMPQLHGLVSPGGSIYAGSPSILSATNPSAGVYTVTFDRNITYCTPLVDTYNAGAGIYGAAYAFSSNTASVFTWYLDSTTHKETPYSFYFYIDVVC